MAITKYNIGHSIVDPEKQNVIDEYKGMSAEDVQAELVEKRNKMVSVFMNLTNDFNKATAIRGNNVFLGKEVYLVGKRKFDRRGCCGTQNYETIFHADTFEEVAEKLHNDGYTLYAVDNIVEYNPVNFWDVEFPEKSAFIYGEERLGLSDEVIKACDEMIYIQSFGSVRSLNVATAAACIMSEYSRQNRL